MDAVDEVKSRLSIEDVIGEYVQLKRSGRNFKGLSPFSSEKTPSFMVSPEKQIWHDFSSGQGGNMFGFVMEMEGLDFRGALELLARKAGIDLDQYDKNRRGPSGKDKERLYELLEAATRFYQVQFSKNQAALQYVFSQRKFTKQTALEWRLGYAPNTGDALVKYLLNKKFTQNEMKSTGVIAQRYNGNSDMFRGRLMIPLADPQGRVIGFTARLLGDDPNAPKYINTPATILYDKSRHVFGLHLAKEAIRRQKYVVLAEGNLDVIASHQAGVRQVVATAGTALTEPHLKALSRFTGDIRLSFDADKAGLNATERAIPIASKAKVSLSIITIPSGKDPDELIKHDPKLWQKVIGEPQYALDWLMARYQKLLDLSSAQGKREYSDVLLPVVRGLADPVEQDHYLLAIADTIGVSREALDAKLQQTGSSETRPLKRPKVTPPPLDKKQVEDIKAQDNFLSLVLLQPKLRQFMQRLEPDMLFTEQAKQLFEFLATNPDFDGSPESLKKLAQHTQVLHLDAMPGTGEQRTEPYGEYGEGAAEPVTQQRAKTVAGQADFARLQGNGVQSLGDYAKILVLLYEELYRGLELTELQYEAARLQARLVERFVKNRKQTLAAKLADASEADTAALLLEVKQLDTLLNQVKGR